MSRPDEQIVDHLTSQQNDNPTSVSDDKSTNRPVDKLGRLFDPTLHGIRADGRPSITAGGFLRLKRGSGSGVADGVADGGSTRSVLGSLGTPSPSEEVDEYGPVGAAVSQSFFVLCTLMGGDEWRPDRREISAMTTAWTEYFRAKGISDIPPEALLGAALIGYAGPRLIQPTTSRRLKNFWHRIRGHPTDDNGTNPHAA